MVNKSHLLCQQFLTNIPIIYPDESYRNEIYCRGLVQLVRLRGCGQFDRLDGRNLVWYVCCSIVSSGHVHPVVDNQLTPWSAIQISNGRS